MQLRPVLGLVEAEHGFQGKYLSSADYDTVVDRDAMGTLPSGQPAFVFLRSAFNDCKALQTTYRSLCGLPFNRVQNSLRKTALRGSQGWYLDMGWLNDSRTGPRPAARTWTHPTLYDFTLVPLLAQLGALMRQYLPDCWQRQATAARRNGERLVGAELQTLVGAKGVRVVHADRTGRPVTEHDIPQPVFSTVTVNKNAIFRAHADAKNESGYSCITTFGAFTGGHLCFPRLRVAFALQPGDVLIAPANTEQHGNIAPLAGTRISVVAYLRNMAGQG
jgi:hypothetical protein